MPSNEQENVSLQAAEGSETIDTPKNDIIVVVNTISMEILEYIMRSIFPLILPGGWSILVLNIKYKEIPSDIKGFIIRMIGRFFFKEIVIGKQTATHIKELPHFTTSYMIKINGNNLIDREELYNKIRDIHSKGFDVSDIITEGDIEIITKKALFTNAQELFDV